MVHLELSANLLQVLEGELARITPVSKSDVTHKILDNITVALMNLVEEMGHGDGDGSKDGMESQGCD